VWDVAAEAFRGSVGRRRKGCAGVHAGRIRNQPTIEAIRQTKASKGYILLPLHGELTPRDQDAAVARYDQPKVVVATNVAETSITIDGVGLVIDSGLARIPRYDPNRGINTLLVKRSAVPAQISEQEEPEGRRRAMHAIVVAGRTR